MNRCSSTTSVTWPPFQLRPVNFFYKPEYDEVSINCNMASSPKKSISPTLRW